MDRIWLFFLFSSDIKANASVSKSLIAIILTQKIRQYQRTQSPYEIYSELLAPFGDWGEKHFVRSLPSPPGGDIEETMTAKKKNKLINTNKDKVLLRNRIFALGVTATLLRFAVESSRRWDAVPGRSSFYLCRGPIRCTDWRLIGWHRLFAETRLVDRTLTPKLDTATSVFFFFTRLLLSSLFRGKSSNLSSESIPGAERRSTATGYPPFSFLFLLSGMLDLNMSS